jgi:hypothetical protein
MNLASNALKFTDQGEIEIRIEPGGDPAAAGSSPGHFLVRCVVRDTGIGIPRDKQDVIFDAFTQADSSDTRRYGGTGLGLAISQRLVALMGGQVGVESEVGRGSTFWFTARLARVARSDSTRVPRILRGRRVLVVDHNATSRRALERTLSSAGCTVRSAASGAEVEGLLREASERSERFDAALLDMSLPLAVGDLWAHAPMPTIGLRPIRREGVTSPSGGRFAAFLRKPIKQLELLDVLASVTLPRAPYTARRRSGPTHPADQVEPR